MPSTDPVHITSLKYIARSPAHYLAALENPKDSPAMRLGRLVHTIVLGGPPSAVWEGERRGKAWQEFKAAHEGAEIVTKSEVENATRIANAVLTSPVARPWLDGQTERAVEWTTLGRKCATHGIDILGKNFIADLKTTTDAHPERFMRAAVRMGYDSQLAWYRDAARHLGHDIEEGALIAVEVSPPYAVTVLRASPRIIEQGARRARLWLERLLACEAANEWPSYAQDVIEWDVDSEDLSILIDGESIDMVAQ